MANESQLETAALCETSLLLLHVWGHRVKTQVMFMSTGPTARLQPGSSLI